MSFSYKENGYRCKNRKQTDMISIKGNVKGNFTISSKEERSSENFYVSTQMRMEKLKRSHQKAFESMQVYNQPWINSCFV
jgi:hypothetical protein